jgi:mono/diheme cytochrome c family protein
MKALKASLLILALVLVAGLGLVYGGVFNVAADSPHWSITYRLIEWTRERSITARVGEVGAPPDFGDSQLIAMGAEHYAEMCTGCHLAPGMKETEIRAGLYPRPPRLVEHASHRRPAEAFWIIKHGLKMTGMPAWGVTHDDRSIWAMVAFLQKLPELSSAQYEALVEQGHGSEHMHGDADSASSHEHASTPHSDDDEGSHSGGEAEHEHDGAAAGASASGARKSGEDSKSHSMPH